MYFKVRSGESPLTEFITKFDALVDDDLAVVIQRNLRALQRPRGRAFKIDTAFVIAAAMAWALEFIFVVKPVRCASQVRADSDQRVEAFFLPDDPNSLRVFVTFRSLRQSYNRREGRL